MLTLILCLIVLWVFVGLCVAAVVIPIVKIKRRLASNAPGRTPLPAPNDYSDTAIRTLIHHGYQNEAIKRLRQRDGTSLEAAKALAETLEATMLTSAPIVDPRLGALWIDPSQVRRLLIHQGRDAAISYLAEQNGLSLEEATYYVALLE